MIGTEFLSDNRQACNMHLHLHNANRRKRGDRVRECHCALRDNYTFNAIQLHRVLQLACWEEIALPYPDQTPNRRIR